MAKAGQTDLWNLKNGTLAALMLGWALPLMVVSNIPVYVFLFLGLIAGSIGLKPLPRFSSLLSNRAVWLMFALLAWLGVCSWHGINPPYSLAHWGVVVGLAVAGFGLYRVFAGLPEAAWQTWEKALVDSYWAACILAALTFMFDPWMIKQGFYSMDDNWVAMHLRNFSSVLAVVLPFCWIVWLRGENGKFRMNSVALFNIAFSILMTFICAGRAGWLGLAGAGALLIVMLVKHYKLKLDWKKIAVAGAAGVVVAVPLFLFLFGSELLEERVGLFIPPRGLGGGRLDIWHLAWEAAITHPLMGIGVQAYRFLPNADAHPHDFVLQLAAEGGFIALAVGLVLLAYTFRRFLKPAAKDPRMLAAAASLLAFAICALTNKSIFNPAWLIYLVTVVAIGAGLMKAGKAKPKA